MSLSSAKRLGKQIIGYPEANVPVASSVSYVAQIFNSPGSRFKAYALSVFPIINWITKYNLGWLSGDLIAGLTVGMVVVPQGMSYAILASLPAEYGLYSSFVGVLIYCFFATSKDVSIGPVAVMSLTVANIIKHVQHKDPQFGGPQIATVLAFITGFIVLGIGLLRIGWVVEFISAPAVSGFMTGSAISIAAGQVPGLMGITGFDTRAATYKVIINTLKGLPRTKLDAAWGLTGLFALFAIQYACLYLGKKYTRRARFFFFVSVFRNAFVLLILTLSAWLYCRHRKSKSGKYPIKILLTVPSGLKHVKRPSVNSAILKALAPELPVATIILLLEHIAISKSFGRLNGYKINPNQELIAIGVTNTIGSCLGAYPATGSFSRTALKSKSGVRTPLAGVVTAIIVIVALYGLTSAFFWIPSAGLSAIIIHAVADLVASPSQVYSYWRVSPLEFVIWLAAVFVTVFSSIENGIYTSIGASVVLLLVRVAHPRGSFLGKVTVRGTSGDQSEREVFLPLDKGGITHPDLKVVPPSPGVLVYRFEESYLYPNASIANSALVDYVKENIRRGRDMTHVKLSDRPWNDPGPGRGGAALDQARNETKPLLYAIVLDFSTVSHIDTTATQALIDARTEIEKWTGHQVEFHFATILSPWIRRALVAGGFGTGISSSKIREVAAVVPYEHDAPGYQQEDVESGADLKKGRSESESSTDDKGEYAPLVSPETPFFHIDLAGAVRAAESGVGRVLE